MWSRRSHTLAPLTNITPSKVKFKWTKIEKYAFNKIKWIMARVTLLTYPGFNETFKIHTNASYFQLGVVIIQNLKSIAFYGIKLTYSKKRYTVT